MSESWKSRLSNYANFESYFISIYQLQCIVTDLRFVIFDSIIRVAGIFQFCSSVDSTCSTIAFLPVHHSCILRSTSFPIPIVLPLTVKRSTYCATFQPSGLSHPWSAANNTVHFWNFRTFQPLSWFDSLSKLHLSLQTIRPFRGRKFWLRVFVRKRVTFKIDDQFLSKWITRFWKFFKSLVKSYY